MSLTLPLKLKVVTDHKSLEEQKVWGGTIKEFRVLGVYLEVTKNLGHICNCKKTTTLWLFLKRLGFMTQMTVKVLNAEGNHGGKDSHTPESY